jgi:hypothetical protein
MIENILGWNKWFDTSRISLIFYYRRRVVSFRIRLHFSFYFVTLFVIIFI